MNTLIVEANEHNEQLDWTLSHSLSASARLVECGNSAHAPKAYAMPSDRPGRLVIRRHGLVRHHVSHEM